MHKLTKVAWPNNLSLFHDVSILEYIDDSIIIPKNTSVIVRRVPAAPGRRFFQPRTLTARTGPSFRPTMPVATAPIGEEDNKIAAMMNESSSHWSQNQEMPSQYFKSYFYLFLLF